MDDQVLVYTIPKPAAVPASTITGGDWTTMDERVDGLEARGLSDLPDVDVTDIADGDVLVYDSGSVPPWTPGTVDTAITLANTGFTPIATDIHTVVPRRGIAAVASGTPGFAYINPTYGGTGSAETIARSDHSHGAEVSDILPGAATGVLSSGTRTLDSSTTKVLTSGVVYDFSASANVVCRNNINNGNANLLFRIGTESGYPERSRTFPTVGGVPVAHEIKFRGVITGAGSGVPISFKVQFVSGDPVDVRDWELEYCFRPRK